MASTKSLDGVIKRLWASKEAGGQNHFDLLFNKNVPHILEKIFFNLEDYDSFMACLDVSKAWRGLFSSELFKKRAKYLLYKKIGFKWRNGVLYHIPGGDHFDTVYEHNKRFLVPYSLNK